MPSLQFFCPIPGAIMGSITLGTVSVLCCTLITVGLSNICSDSLLCCQWGKTVGYDDEIWNNFWHKFNLRSLSIHTWKCPIKSITVFEWPLVYYCLLSKHSDIVTFYRYYIFVLVLNLEWSTYLILFQGRKKLLKMKPVKKIR